MIRIILNIKNYSPFLSTVSGEIVVEHIDFRELDAPSQIKPVLNCSFDYKPGQKGYKCRKGDNGVNHNLFEVLKPQIELMIDSYVSGMKLADYAHSWIADSLDKSLDVWLKEKGINHEITTE